MSKKTRVKVGRRLTGEPVEYEVSIVLHITASDPDAAVDHANEMIMDTDDWIWTVRDPETGERWRVDRGYETVELMED
jgi:hypothetical protein